MKGDVTLLNDCIDVWQIEGVDNPTPARTPVADNNASSATLNDTRHPVGRQCRAAELISQIYHQQKGKSNASA